MTAMTCRVNGLFSVGEDFDDEDLLGTDWAFCSASGPADVAAAVSSCALRAPSSSSSSSSSSSDAAARRESEKNCLRRTGERSAAPCNGTASMSSTHAAAVAVGQTVAPGLRKLASSFDAPRLPTLNNPACNLASQQRPGAAQDDFDDWDVDLADLDECDRQIGLQPPAPAPPVPAAHAASSAKTLRPPTCGGIQTRHGQSLRALSSAHQASGSSSNNPPPRTSFAPHLQSPNLRPAFLSSPPQTPSVFRGPAATPPAPSPINRTFNRPQHPQKSWATPSPRGRGLFETVSPAPSSSPSVSSSTLSPHPLRTPVLTNRLVQLVSASNKLPKKRPRSEPHHPRTRRFPGPAGLLPQQPQGQSLDAIVVSVPQTPAHGVVARPPSQTSSSQAEEDEFSGGAWAAIKTEMGLDERNPSCFLHSYSVVMVIRKAALKQLAKNKVPNMAVLLKSIIHTHADAKAVFKDPTGEIQGTVHRRLLEDRAEELKVGAVLLLKQVGVFSPSNRNHYLNVTPNNLLRIYAPDGVGLSSVQLPPLVLEPMLPSPARPPAVLREPVSQMHLVFDEEDDEGQEGEKRTEGGGNPQAPTDTTAGPCRGPEEPDGKAAPQDPDWEADDDLDELLGELPEDTYSL